MIDTLEPRNYFATLTAGQSVITGIRSAGVQKNYSLDLTAGQAFVVAAGDNGSAFTTELILIAPTGKAIARSVGAQGGFIGKVAPVNGTYIVRVRDVARSNSASVTLTTFYTGASTIADSDDATPPNSGRRYAATIGPGDLDVYAIPATKGQFLSITANENANGADLGVAALIVAPDGTGITSMENEAGFNVDTNAAQTGTYYAVIYEPGANATGRYGFSIARTPGAQTTEDPDTQTPLTSGVPRTGDLPSGDNDVFQVSVGRGDTATVSVDRTGGSTDPMLVLVDPMGNAVTTATTDDGEASGTTLRYTATVSGTYSIVLRNNAPDTGGTYSLTFTRS